MKAKYFLINGGANVTRVMDDVDYAYLDHTSGEWVPRNSLFSTITFEASTREISMQQAQQWVTKNHPDLPVEWL